MKMIRIITTYILAMMLFSSLSCLKAATLEEFYLKRADIRENISRWSGKTDPVWIIKEWIKITTERGEDYQIALEIVSKLEKSDSDNVLTSVKDASRVSLEPVFGSTTQRLSSITILEESDEIRGSIVGVHWYSGDKDMTGGIGGWNVETICGISDENIENTLAHARIAQSHGLTNMIRIDFKERKVVPNNMDEMNEFCSGFIRAVHKLSEVSSIFIVGNEPNNPLEGGITPGEYVNAYGALYKRKGEMPPGSKLLAAGPKVFISDSVKNDNFLDWLEEMSNGLDAVDGFAIHTYGDPTQGNPDPSKPCLVADKPYDCGFLCFRDQIMKISKKWEAEKPVYISVFNTDINGLYDNPNPRDNYAAGWINKAFEAVRVFNSTRENLPSVKALCWFTDRSESRWESFSLRHIPQAREDIKAEFHNMSNHR